MSPDPDGKLKVLEYELAGVFVLLGFLAIGYLLRRKHKRVLNELKTLQAVVPV